MPILDMLFTLFVCLLLLVVYIVHTGLIIVRAKESVIIERLGSYYRTLESGIYWFPPLVFQQRSANWHFVGGKPFTGSHLDSRVQTLDFEPQLVMTKEGIQLKIDGTLYFRIVDPKACMYSVVNLYAKVVEDARICLRDHFVALMFEQAVRDYGTITDKVTRDLEKRLSKECGIEVTRVEIQHIEFPKHLEAETKQRAQNEQKQRTSLLRMQAEMESDKKEMELNEIRSIKQKARARQDLELKKMQLEAEHAAAKLQTENDNEQKRMAATAEAEVQRITLQARLEHAALECKRLALMAEAEADRVMKMDRADLQGIDMTQLDSASVLSYRLQKSVSASSASVQMAIANSPNTTFLPLPAEASGLAGLSAVLSTLSTSMTIAPQGKLSKS